MEEKEAWALQLDWSNIVSILRLDKFDQIPEAHKYVKSGRKRGAIVVTVDQ